MRDGEVQGEQQPAAAARATRNARASACYTRRAWAVSSSIAPCSWGRPADRLFTVHSVADTRRRWRAPCRLRAASVCVGAKGLPRPAAQRGSIFGALSPRAEFTTNGATLGPFFLYWLLARTRIPLVL